MLGCTETVTVVHCNGTGYTATVFEGVSWFDRTQVRTEDRGLVFANAVKVRIPAASLGGAALPAVGDHLFRGALPAGETIGGPADLARYGARRIMAVGDNRRGALAHVAVIGQ